MKARYDIPENDQSFDLKRETYLFTEKRYAQAYSKLDPNNKKAYEKFLRRMEKEGHVKKIPAGSNYMVSWVYQDGVERPELYSIDDHEDFEILNEKELSSYQQKLDNDVLNIVCEVEFPGDDEEGYISWAEASDQGPRYNAEEKAKKEETGKIAYPRKKDKQ